MLNRTLSPPWQTITLLLLAAILTFGVAVVAILPPFEGIDETRHFSRLQSEAFAARPDIQDKSKTADETPRISQEVTDYYRRGPMPYMWISLDVLHQYDPLRGYITYHDFFRASPQQIDSYIKAYRESPLPKGFEPGPEPNIEYQHPQLYYALFAPALKLFAGHASLAGNLLALRLASFFLAFAGLAIGLLATRGYMTASGVKDADLITALGALYPFLMPEFFWEFARVGNDSLCLFFFGIIWAFLLRHMRNPRGDMWIYLGFFMGLGWLTKALMIPISAGVMGFLFLHYICVVRKQPENKRGWWLAPFKILGLAILIGAPVYLLSHLHSGGVGVSEFSETLKTPNAWAQLKKNLDTESVINQLWTLAHTVVWICGSWSTIIIDIPIHKFLCVLTAVIFVAYILASCRRMQPFSFLPLWVLAPFLFGLMAHFLATLARQDNDATPGYYLHILAPAFALIYGIGLKTLSNKKWAAIILACFCLPVIAFNFFILWSYMTVFSGCATPTPEGPTYWLHIADIADCSTRYSSVITNLGVLAWPHMALAFAGATLIFLTAACSLALMRKSLLPDV